MKGNLFSHCMGPSREGIVFDAWRVVSLRELETEVGKGRNRSCHVQAGEFSTRLIVWHQPQPPGAPVFASNNSMEERWKGLIIQTEKVSVRNKCQARG